MSFEKVKAYLSPFGLSDRCIDLKESSATVALAAEALGTEEARIAKTMSFLIDDASLIVVVAGDARVDNHKYKETFHKESQNDSWSRLRKVYRPSPRRRMPLCPSGGGAGVPGCVPEAF